MTNSRLNLLTRDPKKKFVFLIIINKIFSNFIYCKLSILNETAPKENSSKSIWISSVFLPCNFT